MGVQKLNEYFLHENVKCFTLYDIVNVAKEKEFIEILVDFSAFMYHIIERFWRAMYNVTSNKLLWLMGGEYASFDAYLTKLITHLQSCGIRLVMYVEGARGSLETTMKRKLKAWKKGRSKDIKQMIKVMSNIEDQQSKRNHPLKLDLLRSQALATLKACGCEIVHCTTDESDCVLARALKEREAFAILGNDSDFCIFSDCRFIHLELFDMDNDLKLKKQRMPVKPKKLKVGVIRSSDVALQLKLEDEAQLVELSIIAGNDYTKRLCKILWRELNLPEKPDLTEIANWVRTNKRVEKSTVAEMFQTFWDSVHMSREFYSLERDTTQDTTNPLTQAIERAISKGDLPRTIMGMHRGFYWHWVVLEKCRNNCPNVEATLKPPRVGCPSVEAALKPPRVGCPNVEAAPEPPRVGCPNVEAALEPPSVGCPNVEAAPEPPRVGCPNIEAALKPLRALIYEIVRPLNKTVVKEYGQSPFQKFQETEVCVEQKRSISTFDLIDPENISQNQQTFERVMSYYEPDFPHKFMDQYGPSRGFNYLVLRFFLNLTKHYNLNVDKHEFHALVAMVVGRVDEEWYQSLPLSLSVRSVTLASWFQAIYRHAYDFLGKLLYLSDEFPAPKDVFSGAVWTAFYLMCTRQGTTLRPDKIYRIKADIDHILSDKNDVIEQLVEGIFN